jgi:hypothetical protein
VRRLLTIFLLLLLPLHSFAMQGGWLSSENQFNLAHEIEHIEGVSHHHPEDDDSVHYDESSDSVKHFSEHSASQQTVTLPSMAVTPIAIDAVSVAVSQFWQYVPDPIPERPQRPPSSSLG